MRHADREGSVRRRSLEGLGAQSQWRRCDSEKALAYHYAHQEQIAARKVAKRAEAAEERWEAWRKLQREPGRSWEEILGRQG
jgi:hypothetical protein